MPRSAPRLIAVLGARSSYLHRSGSPTTASRRRSGRACSSSEQTSSCRAPAAMSGAAGTSRQFATGNRPSTSSWPAGPEAMARPKGSTQVPDPEAAMLAGMADVWRRTGRRPSITAVAAELLMSPSTLRRYGWARVIEQFMAAQRSLGTRPSGPCDHSRCPCHNGLRTSSSPEAERPAVTRVTSPQNSSSGPPWAVSRTSP